MTFSTFLHSVVACCICIVISSVSGLEPSYANQTFMNTSNGALCLDGTAPDYYFRQGTSPTKFHIFFEGGGWCADDQDIVDEFSSSCYVNTCVDRSKTSFGSSKWHSTSLDINNKLVKSGFGYLSDNVTINPTLYDFNLAFVRYCDGSSFSSNVEEPVEFDEYNTTLYYRGFKILQALIGSLNENYGLSNATQVVIGGMCVYVRVI